VLQLLRYLFIFRLILREETMLPTENELIAVEEINSIKKKLQLYMNPINRRQSTEYTQKRQA
jgi:hypothetical protein